MTIRSGQMWTAAGWRAAELVFGETIQEIRETEDAGTDYLIPGLIDVHVHGGGGHDTMDGEEGIRGLARFHARHGTTTLLPTTITNPPEHIMTALRAVQEVRDRPGPQEAAVVGAHLEGPFLNPTRLGAQPPFAALPTASAVDELLSTDVVRVVTLAPEMEGAWQAAETFTRAGVRVSLGHTQGRAEDAQGVIDAVLALGGVVGGTHLFNAMTGLSGREPGVVGALLAEPLAYAELILDLQHVHPHSALSVIRAKPQRTLLITDAMRAAGLPDGTYDLGGQSVEVVGAEARLAPGSSNPGSLAGSVLTMDGALRGAVACGLTLHEAVCLASAVPAAYLGLSDRGALTPGLRADLVVLDSALRVKQVYLGGQALY
ncbi:N-acetylglucosamine-6-phosphate deacetylase [Deinococcus kurensis]|uniref:N-acetylglucosamine-6-phosphate deacetylase n=1 Tax=Deinococcus kurensis TaxID=2662757 RepID=UPI0012D34637|nr:N-acetylglucosamine-6-phosphate deacetylase [Deinococcus kurensis]